MPQKQHKQIALTCNVRDGGVVLQVFFCSQALWQSQELLFPEGAILSIVVVNFPANYCWVGEYKDKYYTQQ